MNSVTKWCRILCTPWGVGWEPGASALQLSLRSLEVRSRRLGSLEDEVRRYDAAVAAQVEGVQLGLQRLRVVEAKLLQRVVSDWLVLVHIGFFLQVIAL